MKTGIKFIVSQSTCGKAHREVYLVRSKSIIPTVKRRAGVGVPLSEECARELTEITYTGHFFLVFVYLYPIILL